MSDARRTGSDAPAEAGSDAAVRTERALAARDPRLAVGLSAHCQIEGIVSQEALGDLSEGGLYLRTSSQVRESSRIRVVLGLPYIGGQRVCSLSGRIVRVDRDAQGRVQGAAVQFDHETDGADHELLRGFLALWGTARPVPTQG